MFWILWLGIALIFVSSVIGVLAWNGNLLELVKIKTAKNLWLISAIGITLGLILFICSIFTIMNTPDLLIKFSTVNQTPSWMWLAILMLLVGGFIIGIPTQLYQLKFVKLSRYKRRNLFYLGMVLLVISVLLVIWLLLPGNQLPA
ncbi:MAG: hypothetical protein NTY73_04265 [Candidatus Micrarchaeota archaeon]|nr:hypothetical protein [Candidatus Micrarchaeota archaeon]